MLKSQPVDESRTIRLGAGKPMLPWDRAKSTVRLASSNSGNTSRLVRHPRQFARGLQTVVHGFMFLAGYEYIDRLIRDEKLSPKDGQALYSGLVEKGMSAGQIGQVVESIQHLLDIGTAAPRLQSILARAFEPAARGSMPTTPPGGRYYVDRDKRIEAPDFIVEVYGPWMRGEGWWEPGEFTRADLRKIDPKADAGLANWETRNGARADIGLPTVKERNDARLAALGPNSLDRLRAASSLRLAALRREK